VYEVCNSREKTVTRGAKDQAHYILLSPLFVKNNEINIKADMRQSQCPGLTRRLPGTLPVVGIGCYLPTAACYARTQPTDINAST
jgi:hypothetical protein